MEEAFFSGYCRAMDGSRTVTAEQVDGCWEADCAYPNCPFADGCTIGKSLAQLESGCRAV